MTDTHMIPADVAAARVAAAYEAAADIDPAIFDHPSVYMGGPSRQAMRTAAAVAKIIRALTPDDAEAALARIKAEAKAEGMREAYRICKGIRKGAETDDYGIGALDCAIAILAAAEKEAAK